LRSMVMAIENGTVVVSRSKEEKQQHARQQPTNNQQGTAKVVRGRQAAVTTNQQGSANVARGKSADTKRRRSARNITTSQQHKSREQQR
jgi:hypothetical protein